MPLLNFKSPIPDGIPRRRDDRSKEKMFLEHYSWLMECALNITRGQRERGEDLVHDVFVQFLDKNSDIASISDVRGYLNGMLRNLHLLQLRRTTRHPLQSFSLFDHDSAVVGLRAWDSVEQLQSADLLVRACDFACCRKEAALTASILILRFFHGYYPGEIALLLSARRRSVDQWIERGRIETKQYIESPYPLPDSEGAERTISSLATSNALLRYLRGRVFDSCTTDCSVLTGTPTELGVKELAHMVSCRVCLDRLSRKVGLTHVAERMADDISERDDGRPRGGDGGGTGKILSLRFRRKPSKRAILRDVNARRREVFEHKPKELSLVFDGLPHATLLVNGPSNTLNLSLDSKEVPNSIAVLSEQEFHFLILNHDDLICSERRVHRLPLSDDRLLEVTVTPGTLGPSIQVVYRDPLFSAVTEDIEEDEPRAIAVEDRILNFPSRRTDSATDSKFGWRVWRFEKLRNLIPTMNPLLTGAIVLGIAAVLCFVSWMNSGPSLSAGELLDRAQKSERAAIAVNRPGVIYEKIQIRTPRRTTERTIYRDAQGIRRPRRQQLAPEDGQLKDKLAGAGVNWEAPLSPVDYTEWRHRSGAMRDDVTRSGQHLLTLTTTPITSGAVLRESLTIRDTDFHAVGRSIVLRDSGTIEIAELNYDVLPWGAVNQDWFEPLPGDILTPGRIHSSVLPRLPYLPSTEELDEAEISTLLVLNQLSADKGEQIQVTRNGDGIQVRGIVENAQRKLEIESQLIRVRFVTPLVFTVDEMAYSRRSADGTTSIRTASTTRQPSPLELYLVPHGRSSEEVWQLTQNLLQAALSASRESKEVSDVLQQFSFRQNLTANAHVALAALVRSHKRDIGASLDREELLLRSAGFTPSVSQGGANSTNMPGRLPDTATKNLALCRELVSTNGAEARSVDAVVPELFAAISEMRSAYRSLSIDPDPTTAAAERPPASKNQ